eukprot:3692442-Amphidinium_carterae.1
MKPCLLDSRPLRPKLPMQLLEGISLCCDTWVASGLENGAQCAHVRVLSTCWEWLVQLTLGKSELGHQRQRLLPKKALMHFMWGQICHPTAVNYRINSPNPQT